MTYSPRTTPSARSDASTRATRSSQRRPWKSCAIDIGMPSAPASGKFWKSPWLGAACWLALGSWIARDHLSGFLRTGSPAYLMSTTGWALFTLLYCVSLFVGDAKYGDRFTDKQRLAWRVMPFVGLLLALIRILVR